MQKILTLEDLGPVDLYPFIPSTLLKIGRNKALGQSSAHKLPSKAWQRSFSVCPGTQIFQGLAKLEIVT